MTGWLTQVANKLARFFRKCPKGENAPVRPPKPISVQKQLRHAGDWADGVDPEALIQEAYQKGVPFKGRPDSLIYETGRVVGKNGETQVIVRVAEKNIHGHPAAKVLN